MWISFEENFFCCAVAAEGGHASTWVVVNNTCAGNLTARGDYFAARVFGLRNCLPSSWRKRRLTGLVKNYGPTRNRIKMNVCHIDFPFFEMVELTARGRKRRGHEI